jgi:hypothetical protein
VKRKPFVQPLFHSQGTIIRWISPCESCLGPKIHCVNSLFLHTHTMSRQRGLTAAEPHGSPPMSKASTGAGGGAAGLPSKRPSLFNAMSSPAPSPTPHPTEKLLEYILIAEFDIDKGSTVKHQYPDRVGVPDNNLAECMLPEGGHARETDWTVFLVTAQDIERAKVKDRGRALAAANIEQKAIVDSDAMKQEEAKRKQRRIKMHAKVASELKPLAIKAQCFLFDESSKDWKLLKAKEGENHVITFEVKSSGPNPAELGENPTYIMRMSVHDSVVKTLPVISGINFSITDKDNYACIDDSDGKPVALIFPSQDELLKFEQALHKILDTFKINVPATEFLDDSDILQQYNKLVEEENMLVCLNLVRTRLDKNVRRGAIVKAMCFCSRRRDIHCFKGLLLFAINKYFDCEEEKQEALLVDLFNSVNKIDLSEKIRLTELERKVYRACWMKINAGRTFKQTAFKTNCNLFGVSIPVTFPLMMEDDEIGGASVIMLFKKFEDGVMTLFNAMLAGKRVIFLGHGHPAGDVCEAVLSACLLVSPPLRGVLKRCFPYAHLTNIDFLEVPGYIAGVTNPIFQQHQKWWDVLADLSTGTVTLNPDYEQELAAVPPEELPSQMDADFSSKVRSRVALLYGEETIRAMFRDYAQHIVDIALGIEEFSRDAQRIHDTTANKYRIVQLQKQFFFNEYETFFNVQQLNSPFGKFYKEMRRSVRLLQVKKISLREAKKIYKDLKTHVNTKEELMELLSLLPESQGGLAPIAMGIFHESDVIKRTTVELLKSLDRFEEGTRFLNNLNYFMLLTYHQYKDLVLGMHIEDKEDKEDKDDDDD